MQGRTWIIPRDDGRPSITSTVTRDACRLHVLEWLRWFLHDPGPAALQQVRQLRLSADLQRMQWEDFDNAWNKRSEYDL
jgi:hypothetical protein